MPVDQQAERQQLPVRQVPRFVLAMSLLSGLLTPGCSVVGIRSGTEEPRYTVVETLGALQIRSYPSRLAAQTTVSGEEFSARSTGFRRLAGFIFGGNHAGKSIAMTAPVAQATGSSIAMTAPVGQQQVAPSQLQILFFMPANYTEATLPQPNDPSVEVITVAAETIGVYRYTGSIDSAYTAAAQRELLRLLQGSGWVAAGQAEVWFYDPPWTIPFLRRNEAAVAVKRPG